MRQCTAQNLHTDTYKRTDNTPRSSLHFFRFISFHFTSLQFTVLRYTSLSIFHLPAIWNLYHQSICVSQWTACIAVLT